MNPISNISTPPEGGVERRTSRVVNLSMAEADVRAQCDKSDIGVSSLEVLRSGGVRLVTSSVEGAEKIRKKLKSKLVRGDVERTPFNPRTRPW